MKYTSLRKDYCLLIRTWIVFLHAVLLSIESIVVEILAIRMRIDPLVIAAVSIPIAGSFLLALSFASEKKRAFAVFLSWRYLFPGSILVAAGVFAWYDSVHRVGASKEGLLAGPLETVVIVLIAMAVLNEKLTRLQIVGVITALTGFFAIVTSGGGQSAISFGDIEAIMSALAFGGGIIFLTQLTKNHSSITVTGSSLFLSGLILAAISAGSSSAAVITPAGWMALMLFSILPLCAALTYVVGLSRIGASLTSVIGSFSIILTLIFQLVMHWLNVQVVLPDNILLAMTGGILGVIGIYVIHKSK